MPGPLFLFSVCCARSVAGQGRAQPGVFAVALVSGHGLLVVVGHTHGLVALNHPGRFFVYDAPYAARAYPGSQCLQRCNNSWCQVCVMPTLWEPVLVDACHGVSPQGSNVSCCLVIKHRAVGGNHFIWYTMQQQKLQTCIVCLSMRQLASASHTC